MPEDVHPPLADPLLGALVGEYQIIEPIGQGGMGVVYRGIQPVIKKRVAIKVLKPQVAGDEHQVRRLVAEAEAVNAIGHRGIIDIFGMGQLPDGRPYVVMEFLDGEPLDLWLQQQPLGRVPLLTALELLLEICAPLSAAHRANVIHRDLKPSNVFVCRQADGSRFLKLLDFGLAKRAVGLDGNTKQTSQSTVSGTPDYMAPEQARGLSVSPRSDLYALGVMAFELFTGRVPFAGATPMDVMVAHVGTAPPSPRSLEPQLPEGLEALVLRMLAKAPEARPQTVDEVRAALEDAVMALGSPRPRSSREHLTPAPALPPMFSQPTPAPVAVAPVAPVGRRAGATWWAVGFVVLGLAGAGAAYVSSRPEPVVAPTPGPVVLELDAGSAPVDAGAEVVETGPAVIDAAVIDAGVEAPVEIKPARRLGPAPTTRQLLNRIVKLEARAKRKKNLDVAALPALGKYRLEASASDPGRRARLDRVLTEWERSFLKR